MAMKNFKLLTHSLLALIIMASISSCEKNNEVDPMQKVSFSINNLSFDENYASDSEIQHFLKKASYASISIVNIHNNTIKNYNPTISLIDNKPTTDFIKLDTANYKVISFEVYNVANVLIWLSPETKDLYKGLWDLSGASSIEKENIYNSINKDKIFKVSKSGNNRIKMNVLNWKAITLNEYTRPFKDVDVEFRFNAAKIKTLCFFGDICTPNYVSWGKEHHDFVADFRVHVIDTDGETILNTVSTLDEEFEKGPLCVPYPDFADREDDIYTGSLEIWNSEIDKWILIGSIPLDANLTPLELIALTNPEDKDGILDFVLYEGQNCNNPDNLGVNLIIPLPESID